jgi:putative phage-type endonuclease
MGRLQTMSALVPNTPEWEKMRKEKIGASDAPILMGVSPYDTPYSLWQKKLDLLPDTQGWTKHLDRGHDLEPLAREQISQRLGVALAPQVMFHSSIPWMMATLDGLSPDKKTLVEIKCPGEVDHQKALEGKIPEKYFPQIQHQLEVCELEKGYYFSYDGQQGVLIEFYRDDKYIKKLINIEKEFMVCLDNLEAPPLTDRDYKPMESLEWSSLASHYRNLSATLARLEKEQKEIKEKLISMCNGQSSAGAGVKVSKCLRKGSVDYAKIPQLAGINLEPFRKNTVEFWKVLTS